MSSATLASSAKWVNARMTGIAVVHVDAVEQAGQLGAVDLRTTHPERLHAGAFDEVEHLLAVLFPHGVAEDGAEQPDVLAHRFGRLASHLGAADRADGCQRYVRSFGHPPSIGVSRTPRSVKSSGGSGGGDHHDHREPPSR